MRIASAVPTCSYSEFLGSQAQKGSTQGVLRPLCAAAAAFLCIKKVILNPPHCWFSIIIPFMLFVSSFILHYYVLQLLLSAQRVNFEYPSLLFFLNYSFYVFCLLCTTMAGFGLRRWCGIVENIIVCCCSCCPMYLIFVS